MQGLKLLTKMILEDKESKMDRDNAIKEMRELLKLMIEKKALICL